MTILMALMLTAICQGTENGTSVSGDKNISVFIDGVSVNTTDYVRETDAFAEELGWLEIDRPLTEKEFADDMRIEMETGGLCGRYLDALGDEVRIVYAPKFEMYYIDQLFGVDGGQNETDAQMLDRVNQTINHVERFSLPYRYRINRIDNYSWGSTAVVEVRFFMITDNLKQMHRTLEKITLQELGARDSFKRWFRNY